jgi:hypothetical protein
MQEQPQQQQPERPECSLWKGPHRWVYVQRGSQIPELYRCACGSSAHDVADWPNYDGVPRPVIISESEEAEQLEQLSVPQ